MHVTLRVARESLSAASPHRTIGGCALRRSRLRIHADQRDQLVAKLLHGDRQAHGPAKRRGHDFLLPALLALIEQEHRAHETGFRVVAEVVEHFQGLPAKLL